MASTSSSDGHVDDGSQEGITVAIRMRPLNKTEGQNERIWKVLPQYSSVAQTTRDGKPLSERVTGRTFFTFDKTFGEDTNNQQVYDSVAKGIVSSVVQGLNGTIFAYGQTSSGKTFTMQGSGNLEQGANNGSDGNGSVVGGIVHMAARDIFSQIQQQQNRMFLVRVSFLEIYNEEVRDLLSPSTSQTLQIREDPRRGVFVQSVEEIVTDFETLLKILIRGDKSRTFASTGMNERSSRSHTILRVTIESREKEVDMDTEDDSAALGQNGDGAVRISTLNLVDLAGSESVRHTGATGERQKEGGLINQSLLTLSRVIVALGSPNQTHINFRDSKLTRILQPSLSGNARMAVICCATPSELYLEETRSTLQFASRAKLVKTNAQVNEVLDERSMIRRLQRELAEAKRLQTAPGHEQVRDLEKQIATAGSQAMEAKAKLDRLKASILNAGYLFEQRSNDVEGDGTTREDTRQKKRRKSDGSLAPPISPSRQASAGQTDVPTPKTAPRAKKTKLLSRPSLAPSTELKMIQEALTVRNEFVRTLKRTITEHAEQISNKNLDIERMLEEHTALADEMTGAQTQVKSLNEMLTALQGELELTTKNHTDAIAEKESMIVEAFDKIEQSVNEKEQIAVELSDLRVEFDKLQEERVRSAFELAEMTSEKEGLLTERQNDKIKLQDMAGKTEFLATNLHEVTHERDGLLKQIESLNEQLDSTTKENNELEASKTKSDSIIDHLSRTLDETQKANKALKGQLDEAVSARTELLEYHEEAVKSLQDSIVDIHGQVTKEQNEKDLYKETSSKLQQNVVELESVTQQQGHEIIRIQSELCENKNKLSAAEKNLVSLSDERDEIQAEKNSIEVVMANLNQQLVDMESHLSAAEQQIARLGTEKASMTEENSLSLSKLEAQLAESVQKLAEVEGRLTKDKQDLEVSISQREHEKIELQMSLEKMTTELSCSQLERSDLEEKLSSASSAFSSIQETLKLKEEAIEALNTTNETSARELEALRSEAAENTAKLQLRVDDLEGLLAEAEVKNQSGSEVLEEQSLEVSRLRKSIDHLKEELQNQESECGVYKRALQIRVSKSEELESTVERLSTEIDGMSRVHDSQVQTLTNSLEATKAELQMMSQTVDEAATLKLELEERVQSLASQLSCLEELHTKEEEEWKTQLLVSGTSESELKEKLSEMAKEVSHRDDSIVALRSQIDELTNAKNEVGASFAEAKQLIQSLEAENEDIHARLAASLETMNENEQVRVTMSAEHHALQECNDALEAKIEEVQSELEKTLSKMTETESHLNTVLKARDSLLENVKTRESERDEAVGELDRLYESNRQLEASLAQSVSNDELEKLQNDLDKEKADNLELKQLLASVNESEVRLRSALAELERESNEKTKELESANHQLNELHDELVHLQNEQVDKNDVETAQADLLGRIDLLEREKAELECKRNEEQTSWETQMNELKLQMGEEQRMLVQEGDAMMVELRNKIEEHEATITQSREEAYTARQQVEEIIDERNALKEKVEILNGQFSSRNHTQEAEMNDLKAELEKFKSESYGLKESVIDMKEKVRRSNRDIEKANRASEMASSELATFQRKFKNLESQLESSRTEITRLKKRTVEDNPETEETIRRLKSDLLNKDAKIGQIESKIADLTRANEEAGMEIERLKEADPSSEDSQVIEQLRNELKTKEERIVKLKAKTLTKAQTESLKKMKLENTNAKDQISKLKKTIAKLEMEVSSGESDLKKTIEKLEAQLSSVGGDSDLKSEISELRFDNEALEKKLRKFASHCQRLEDDKAAMTDSLRSCQINVDAYDGDLGEAVVHLCDRLTSLEEAQSNKKIQVADIAKTESLENEVHSLRRTIEKYAHSEGDLIDKLNQSKQNIQSLERQIQKVKASSGIEIESKISYLEKENLQLMEDLKSKEKEVRAAHAEMESLRLKVTDQNSTLDFGSVDLRSSKGRERDSLSSSSSMVARARSENTVELESCSTMELMNMAVGSSSLGNPPKLPPSSSKTKAKNQTVKRKGLSDTTNSSNEAMLPPTGKKLRSSTVAGSDKKPPRTEGSGRRTRSTSKAPGLGESTVQQHDADETGECKQS